MFGRDSIPTRVFRYGARAPHVGLNAYWQEEREMHRLRNAIVEIERDRREAAAGAVREAFPWIAETEARLAEIDEAIEAARAEIRRRNVAARKRRPKDDPATARIAELRAERREIIGTHDATADACECFRCRRRAAFRDPALTERLAEIDREAKAREKALYAARLVSWCDYNAVMQSLGGRRSGPPPRFLPWTGQRGRVVVQIQGGASWEELLAGTRQARVVPDSSPPGGAQSPTGRRSRRPWYVLHIRIGRDAQGDSDYRWVAVRFVLDRPVPADGRIQQVHLVRRRVGTANEWSVNFVIARAAGWAKQDTHDARGVCGVDLRWRRLGEPPAEGEPDRRPLLVAYAEGDDGWREEFLIPAERIEYLQYADVLRSIRDREFDAAKAVLAQWLAENDAPDWLREATAHLAQWRSPARLAALVLRWRGRGGEVCPQCGATGDAPCRTKLTYPNGSLRGSRSERVLKHRHRARVEWEPGLRFDGDEAILARLEAWRAQDKHLADWEAAQRRKFQLWRQDHYRRFAARLRWRYETVVVEDANWRELLSRPPAEEQEEPESLNRRWIARLASPGLIRQAIQQSVEDTRAAPSANTSRTCSVCGAGPAHDWDAATERDYRCEAGHRLAAWRNAAHNLIAAAASGGVVQ